MKHFRHNHRLHFHEDRVPRRQRLFLWGWNYNRDLMKEILAAKASSVPLPPDEWFDNLIDRLEADLAPPPAPEPAPTPQAPIVDWSDENEGFRWSHFGPTVTGLPFKVSIRQEDGIVNYPPDENHQRMFVDWLFDHDDLLQRWQNDEIDTMELVNLLRERL